MRRIKARIVEPILARESRRGGRGVEDIVRLLMSGQDATMLDGLEYAMMRNRS
jgi:hypothetical protein